MKKAYPQLWAFLQQRYPGEGATISATAIYDAASWCWDINDQNKASPHLARMVRLGFFKSLGNSAYLLSREWEQLDGIKKVQKNGRNKGR